MLHIITPLDVGIVTEGFCQVSSCCFLGNWVEDEIIEVYLSDIRKWECRHYQCTFWSQILYDGINEFLRSSLKVVEFLHGGVYENNTAWFYTHSSHGIHDISRIIFLLIKQLPYPLVNVFAK